MQRQIGNWTIKQYNADLWSQQFESRLERVLKDNKIITPPILADELQRTDNKLIQPVTKSLKPTELLDN
jgi:hypothetical protein